MRFIFLEGIMVDIFLYALILSLHVCNIVSTDTHIVSFISMPDGVPMLRLTTVGTVKNLVIYIQKY